MVGQALIGPNKLVGTFGPKSHTWILLLAGSGQSTFSIYTRPRRTFQMCLRGGSQWRKFMRVTNRCSFITYREPPTLSDGRSMATANTSTAPRGTVTDEHHAYCRDFVQRHDYEAYLVSQLYPLSKRNGYFAIKAFYVSPRSRVGGISSLMIPEQDELAMIQDNVSSSIIGEMKMQFWRDAVKGVIDVRRPLIFYLAGREHDLGQTSTSSHRSSSIRHVAKCSYPTVSSKEDRRR